MTGRFVPLQANEVWIVQGDPTVYTSQPNGTRRRRTGRPPDAGHP